MNSGLSRLIVTFLFTIAIPATAADVGRVLLAAGDTAAVRDKQIIKLVFGSTVQDKDTLRTGPASNLQVRFIDESILSMRENSELRIDEFRFTGKEDGTERAFFRLLKGGLRKVTGIVGRTNHKNYQMSSVVATIGIRGTDYVARLCQQDCRNPSHSVRDGLYGRAIGVSYGTNRLALINERGEFTFGISQDFFIADAKTAPEILLQPPDVVYDKLAARQRGGTKGAAGGTGKEQAATGGVQHEPRGTTPAPDLPKPVVFVNVADPAVGSVATSQPTTGGAFDPVALAGGGSVAGATAGGTVPPIISPTPTIAGVGAFFQTNDPFNEPNEGGGFFTPANLTTDPPGAAANLATQQKLLGFTLPAAFDVSPSPSGVGISGSTTSSSVIDETVPNSLNAHWGRWTSGTIIEQEGTTINPPGGFHYLYGPLTPPEVVAAKTGSFPMTMVAGTTPTNQLNQTGSFSVSSVNVNFTTRMVTFGTIGFSFPSDSWTFPGPNNTPIQFAAGRGAFIDQIVSGSCSGSTCSTFTPAVLGKTGIFMGPAGDHLGVAFQARTTSGPPAAAQTAKLFSCAPSC